MKWTDKQVKKAQALINDNELIKSRKGFIMYQTKDEGLALFRVKAGNDINEIILRHVNNKPLTASLKSFIRTWLNDGNDHLRGSMSGLMSSLERLTNRPVKY